MRNLIKQFFPLLLFIAIVASIVLIRSQTNQNTRQIASSDPSVVPQQQKDEPSPTPAQDLHALPNSPQTNANSKFLALLNQYATGELILNDKYLFGFRIPGPFVNEKSLLPLATEAAVYFGVPAKDLKIALSQPSKFGGKLNAVIFNQVVEGVRVFDSNLTLSLNDQGEVYGFLNNLKPCSEVNLTNNQSEPMIQQTIIAKYPKVTQFSMKEQVLFVKADKRAELSQVVYASSHLLDERLLVISLGTGRILAEKPLAIKN
ncbi:MAG TPA: hypothetical protein PLU50_02480 [Pseudobdellovibrionaceae bacterium]|nr:hypothetical protein [Pseudobdellovibrionaceae bacterium]